MWSLTYFLSFFLFLSNGEFELNHSHSHTYVPYLLTSWDTAQRYMEYFCHKLSSIAKDRCIGKDPNSGLSNTSYLNRSIWEILGEFGNENNIINQPGKKFSIWRWPRSFCCIFCKQARPSLTFPSFFLLFFCKFNIFLQSSKYKVQSNRIET